MSPASSAKECLVVGYVADFRGHDALEFACFLARGVDTEVIITMVLPEGRGVSSAQLREWQEDALETVPGGVRARVEFRESTSDARGLLDAATEHDAAMIVIGAAAGPFMRNFTVGSVANTLLHASPVPVGLAPRGFRAPTDRDVSRITGVFGTRAGSEAVIGRTVQRALDRGVSMRLVSLVQVDLIDPRDIPEVTDEARQFGGRHLEKEAAGLIRSGRATIEIAEGRDLEDALANVEWLPDEIAVLGSSRLGRGNSVFLGPRAHRILSVLSVPVIVIPSDYRGPEGPETPPETRVIPIIPEDEAGHAA